MPSRRPHPDSERLAAIVEGSDDAIVAMDASGRFTQWNTGAVRLFGYTAEEAIGRSLAVLIPPDRQGEDGEIMRRILGGEHLDHFETERLCRDGSRVGVSLTISALRDASGAIVGASAIARDVSDRRTAEAERSRLAALVAASGDAIIATDKALRITNCNAAAAELYHLSCEEMLGRVATDISESSSGDRADQMRRALSGETVHSEGFRTRRDGTEFALAATATPVRSASGEIVGLVSIARDITPQWHARVALERNERRNRMLAEASSVLDRSLHVDHVVDAMTRIVVASFADLCFVLARDGAERELVGVNAIDPLVADLIRRALADGLFAARAGELAEHALGAGDGSLIEATDPALLADWAAQSPALRDELLPISLTSLMVVPLRTGGSTHGLMFVASLRPDRRFDRHELRLARELADRAAQALENARLLASATAAREEAEAAARDLSAAQERFSSAFENAPIGMALVSASEGSVSRIDEANPALCELTGFVSDELRGCDLIETLVHPQDRRSVRRELARVLRGGAGTLSAEHRYVRNGGADVWVQTSVALLPGTSDAELVLQVQDITEQKRYEGQLRYLADHDPLTGLYNRRRFVEELDRAAANAHLHGVPTAVLVLDIDHFKYVNDTYGHGIGDEVLTAIARTLVGRTRETDVVGRLGGDEFGIVLTHSNGDDAHAVAGALLVELRERGLVALDDQSIAVTASIGCRIIDRVDGLTADELIVAADIAMYDAKEQGRNRVSIAAHDSIEPTRLRQRLALSDLIRRALARDDGFVLFEQPICALPSGEIDRTEILVRMPDGEGDLLPPSVFLPVADHFGLMSQLDMWVIAHAIELLAARQAAGIQIGMEVNLSGTSIGDSAVIDFIAESVRSSGIDPTALTFEVTETEAIVNIDRARLLSRRLSSLGCQFALDDFGAGFGSFYYLKHLPFDVVKIDGDFIRALPESMTDQLTVQAIVTIARGLQKQTVAEFVGDRSTAEMLRGYGVDFAQGYHIGQPEPADPWPSYIASSGARA